MSDRSGAPLDPAAKSHLDPIKHNEETKTHVGGLLTRKSKLEARAESLQSGDELVSAIAEILVHHTSE